MATWKLGGLTILVMATFSLSAAAALHEDPAAMNGWKDHVYFNRSQSPAVSGYLDYAVYAPGTYSGSVAFDDYYVYAYQLSSMAASDVAIDFFGVGLSDGITVNHLICDPLCDYAMPAGKAASASFALSESVLFLFQGTPISGGDCSATLLMTSEYGPGMGSAVISSGITGGVIVDVPTPIPDPATIALFALGAAFLRKRT